MKNNIKILILFIVILTGMVGCNSSATVTKKMTTTQGELPATSYQKEILSEEGSADLDAIKSQENILQFMYYTANTKTAEGKSRWYISQISGFYQGMVLSLGPIETINGVVKAGWKEVGKDVATTDIVNSQITIGSIVDNPSFDYKDWGLGLNRHDPKIQEDIELIRDSMVNVKWWFFKASNGSWYIINSTGSSIYKFGTTSGQYDWKRIDTTGKRLEFFIDGDTKKFRVVTNIENSVPILLDSTATVEENATAGTVIGNMTISSTGDTPITEIALSGTGNENFEVTTDGNITVKAGALLDYETTSEYNLTAIATNEAGDSTGVDVNISVIDIVNDDSDNDYIPDDIEAMLDMNSSNSDEDGDGILDGLQLSGDKGDDFFDKQWHIRSTGANSSPNPDSTTIDGNDLGVMDIYHTYMGYNRGTPLVIQVVDTGVDADHPDLIDNMDLSLSRNSDTKTMGDPVETANSSHGTMCAGIIGARAFNGKGVRGIAPFAKIAGSNWLSYQSAEELEEAWTKNDSDGKIILSSNSWGTDAADTYTFYEDLMAYAASNLRKVNGVAKGKLFIQAAGNGRGSHHDSGLAYSASNPYVITVAGLKSDNTHASYSSPGSNILVSGYSGSFYQDSATIGTTYIAGRSALVEDLEYNRTKDCDERSSDNECSMPTWDADNLDTKSYTYGMNGTSAATPTVAGSLALVLEACPTLPWRDVKYLIAKNAIKVDTGNASWVTNGAGLHHSVDYGFGLINPSAMINECKAGYTELTNSSTFSENFDPDPDMAIPDNNTTGISYDFTVVGNKVIEWIGVTVTSNHTYGGDLEIYLTSPVGTTTRLMRGDNSGRNYSMTAGFRYGSVAFMGESTAGTWTIKIADIGDVDTGNLESLTFELFGH
jgi:subtilisin-like proprotein convertase family protein